MRPSLLLRESTFLVKDHVSRKPEEKRGGVYVAKQLVSKNRKLFCASYRRDNDCE
jgi:hypothetical protein